MLMQTGRPIGSLACPDALRVIGFQQGDIVDANVCNIIKI
jgi:hypothetical protein